MRAILAAALLLLSGAAHAQIITINENLDTSTSTFYFDTNSPRLNVGTDTYTGGIPGAALFVGSNAVVGTGTGASNQVVIYATGSVMALGVRLSSGPATLGISTGAATDSTMGGIGTASRPLGVNFSTITTALSGKQASFVGISSSCAAGFYLSTGTWVNGVATGGGCVAVPGGGASLAFSTGALTGGTTPFQVVPLAVLDQAFFTYTPVSSTAGFISLNVSSNGPVMYGSVVAFNSTTCPGGWNIADGTNGTPDLRGLFIRGAGTNGTYTTSQGATPAATFGTESVDTIQAHTHVLALGQTPGTGTPQYIEPAIALATLNTSITNSTGGNETRPINYALTYCVSTTTGVFGPTGATGAPGAAGVTLNGGWTSASSGNPAQVYLTTATNSVTMQSTVTVQGNAFSVGGSSFSVSGGSTTVAYKATVGTLTAGNIQWAILSAGKCTSTPCAITTKTSGITSVTRASTGIYTLNYPAGTFVVSPACWITGMNAGISDGICKGNGTPSTSSWGMACEVPTTGALQDDSFSVWCTGP